MKQIFSLRYLSAILVFAPLMPVSFIKNLAAVPVYLAPANSTYDKYMQLGYDATGQRNYSVALTYLPHLKMGKEYHWSSSVICDRQDRSEDLVVEGSIKRTAKFRKVIVKLWFG